MTLCNQAKKTSGYDYQPTDLQPGSVEKVNLMIERLENNCPIFHPGDRNSRRQLGEPRGPVSSDPCSTSAAISATIAANASGNTQDDSGYEYDGFEFDMGDDE